MQILGWSVGQTKLGDETGVWHLVIVEGKDPQTKVACGCRLRMSGQVQRAVPSEAWKCRRCELIAKNKPSRMWAPLQKGPVCSEQ